MCKKIISITYQEFLFLLQVAITLCVLEYMVYEDTNVQNDMGITK